MAFGLLLVATAAYAQDVTEYRDLRASRPDGRTVRVDGLTLARDGYRIELRSGVVHLLAPLGGHTFGAVFVGEGVYHLSPATAAERRHLALVTNTNSLETLTDRFTRLVLLFTDDTAAEVLAHAPVTTGAPDQAATRVFDEYLQRERRGEHPNLHLRVLADLLNRPARTDGVFLALAEGDTYSPVLMAVDPLGISNLTTRFAFFGGEEVAFVSFDTMNSGLWYSSAFTPEATGGRGKAIRSLADATHYDIDTILDGGAFSGTTTITFTPTTAGVRVFPLHLFERLKIRSATLERNGTAMPVGILQEEPAQGWFARTFGDEVAAADVAVLFREPLAAGAPVRLTVEYEGRDVLQGSQGRFVVRARESWYPNLGTFSDLATYDITFHYPERNQLVAVGELVSERVEGGRKTAVWRSERPIRVAGFNYGEFQKASRNDAESGVSVDVYTNRGPQDTNSAANALADAVNTSRVANLYFGAPPYRRLSITQQPSMTSGQSWPSLVFLPTIASGTDFALGFAGVDPRAVRSLKEFANTVAWHEVAHQWWGHQIGWSSYRDQWLSEGLSEFTAALMLEVTSGRQSAAAFWALRRSEVLDRTTGVPNAEAGAITQGFRLGTSRSPGAARAMIYSKGAYVVHMLRMMMREDRVPDPDRAFKAMMHDFVSSWTGKNPSTDDFQAVAERHMTKGTNLAGDGRLDYFFNQWVHGTDIPTLTSALEATEVGGRKYRISGTITQAGVPAGFRTLVPIYLDLGNDRVERLGTVMLSGSVSQKVAAEVELPQRPRRVLINAMHDVLTR